MNKVKVLHLIHGLSTGGAETLVKNYALYFDRNRFDIVLLCLKHEANSPYEIVLKDCGVNVLYIEDYLPFKKQSTIITKFISRVCEYLFVKKIIHKEMPDVIHSHLPINNYIKFAKPKPGTVIFHTIHSDPKQLWLCNNKKRTRDYNAARWLVKHYDMNFIVLHERMKKEVKEMFGVSDSIVLNNGVDVKKIKNTRPSNETRNELGIPGDGFVIGHVGRFSKVKNHGFLADVFSEIVKKNDGAFLLMIGDGPDKSKIVEKLDKFDLKGKYLIIDNRNDIPDLLNAMDVFVFPSLYEGLPLSLVEAQIARKPCFVSDTINEHAFISNLVVRLSLKQSARKWSDAILSYKEPKKIMVDEDNWDIKKITRKLEQVYLDVLLEKKDGEE